MRSVGEDLVQQSWAMTNRLRHSFKHNNFIRMQLYPSPGTLAWIPRPDGHGAGVVSYSEWLGPTRTRL